MKSTMRATVIDRYGGPDRLKVREIPVPRPSATEVLIRVDTAGVGTWDPEMRSGAIKSDEGFPLVLGTGQRRARTALRSSGASASRT